MLVVGSPNVIVGDYGGGGDRTVGRAVPISSSPEYDEGFILIEEETGEPVFNRRYRITRADGSTIEGRTNDRGRTMVIDTDSPEELKIEVFDAD